MRTIDGISMDYNELQAYTIQRFLDPKVGDRFEEMLSFWMYVIHVEKTDRGTFVYTAHFHPPCETCLRDAKIYKHDLNSFIRRYTYDSIPDKSWVLYCDNSPDHIEGLYREALAAGVIDEEHCEGPKTRLDWVE